MTPFLVHTLPGSPFARSMLREIARPLGDDAWLAGASFSLADFMLAP